MTASRRAVLDLPCCARRSLDGNCRLKSGKNHERVPPRATGSFSDGRKGTKSPPKNPSPWAACPGIDALLACGERRRAATRIQRGPQAPLWIPRRESPCDPARRAGILRGCLRRMPGARYARRPLAGAPPRDPGLSPLRGPGPTSRNSKRNLREYLAITRRLPSLPTGTPAEGSIQVAGAPNEGNGKCRRGRPEPNVLRGPGELFQKFPWKNLSCTPPGAGRRAGVAWLRASWSAGMSARKGEGSPGQSRTSSSLARVMPT